MSGLGDKLWRDYGGDNVPRDAQTLARDAIQRYGSGRAAGRALGVDEAQIRRWRDGKVANSPNVERMVRDMREQMATARSGDPIDLKFRHARRTRNLTFGEAGAAGKRGLRPGTEAAIAAAFARGDRRGMASAFIGGVQDAWYRKQLKLATEADDLGRSGDGVGEDSDAVGVVIAS